MHASQFQGCVVEQRVDVSSILCMLLAGRQHFRNRSQIQTSTRLLFQNKDIMSNRNFNRRSSRRF